MTSQAPPLLADRDPEPEPPTAGAPPAGNPPPPNDGPPGGGGGNDGGDDDDAGDDRPEQEPTEDSAPDRDVTPTDEPATPATPAERTESGGEPPTGDRNVKRRVLVGVALATVALGLFSTVSTLRLKGDLTRAEVHLTEAQSALDDGEVDVAISELAEAEALLGRSRRTLNRPDLRLAGFVPEIGRDIRIARAIVIGADDLVLAGSDALEAARSLIDGDLDDDGLPVGEIAALAPRLRATAEAATSALDRVLASPNRAVTSQVAGARDRMIELLTPISDKVDVAADLAEQLPGFLGADGPRRYLLAAANTAELRGVGGYLGSYAILTVEDGELDFGNFEPLQDLPELPRDAVDVSLLAPRYERFGATWRFKNANMTPDMPSAARVLLSQWQVHSGQQLDGVLIVDPFALAQMLQVTGPVTISDGTRLDQENAVRYLTNEAYANYDDADDRKSELGEAATLILAEFLGDAGAAANHLGDLATIVSERRLLIYSANDAEQGAFARAGLDGAFPDPVGDFTAVTINSGTNAKVDFYLELDLDYEVQLTTDGAANALLSVEAHNGAPRTGAPKYVLGPSAPGLEVGDNRFYLSTYCATTCLIEGAEGGLTGRAALEEELGHPVAGLWVELPSGGRATVRYQWRTERAWRVEAGQLVYDLFVRMPAATRPTGLSVSVIVPDGYVVAEAPGFTTEGDRLRWTGRQHGDVRLQLRLDPVASDARSGG